MSNNIKPSKTFLLQTCPFCFKFLLFMTEAGLRDQIEVVTFDAEATNYQEKRAELKTLLGRDAAFPTVEIELGVYLSDSDALIEHYAKKHGVDQEKLMTLEYYKKGVFSKVISLFMENKELKSKLNG